MFSLFVLFSASFVSIRREILIVSIRRFETTKLVVLIQLRIVVHGFSFALCKRSIS